MANLIGLYRSLRIVWLPNNNKKNVAISVRKKQ